MCAGCLDFLGNVPADRDVQQARTISLSDDDVVLRRQQKMVGGVGLIDDVQWRTHVKFSDDEQHLYGWGPVSTSQTGRRSFTKERNKVRQNNVSSLD